MGLHLGKGNGNGTPRRIVLEKDPRGTKEIQEEKEFVKSSIGPKCRDEWKLEAESGERTGRWGQKMWYV